MAESSKCSGLAPEPPLSEGGENSDNQDNKSNRNKGLLAYHSNSLAENNTASAENTQLQPAAGSSLSESIISPADTSEDTGEIAQEQTTSSYPASAEHNHESPAKDEDTPAETNNKGKAKEPETPATTAPADEFPSGWTGLWRFPREPETIIIGIHASPGPIAKAISRANTPVLPVFPSQRQQPAPPAFVQQQFTASRLLQGLLAPGIVEGASPVQRSNYTGNVGSSSSSFVGKHGVGVDGNNTAIAGPSRTLPRGNNTAVAGPSGTSSRSDAAAAASILTALSRDAVARPSTPQRPTTPKAPTPSPITPTFAPLKEIRPAPLPDVNTLTTQHPDPNGILARRLNTYQSFSSAGEFLENNVHPIDYGLIAPQIHDTYVIKTIGTIKCDECRTKLGSGELYQCKTCGSQICQDCIELKLAQENAGGDPVANAEEGKGKGKERAVEEEDQANDSLFGNKDSKDKSKAKGKAKPANPVHHEFDWLGVRKHLPFKLCYLDRKQLRGEDKGPWGVDVNIKDYAGNWRRVNATLVPDAPRCRASKDVGGKAQAGRRRSGIKLKFRNIFAGSGDVSKDEHAGEESTAGVGVSAPDNKRRKIDPEAKARALAQGTANTTTAAFVAFGARLKDAAPEAKGKGKGKEKEPQDTRNEPIDVEEWDESSTQARVQTAVFGGRPDTLAKLTRIQDAARLGVSIQPRSTHAAGPKMQAVTVHGYPDPTAFGGGRYAGPAGFGASGVGGSEGQGYGLGAAGAQYGGYQEYGQATSYRQPPFHGHGHPMQQYPGYGPAAPYPTQQPQYVRGHGHEFGQHEHAQQSVYPAAFGFGNGHGSQHVTPGVPIYALPIQPYPVDPVTMNAALMHLAGYPTAITLGYPVNFVYRANPFFHTATDSARENFPTMNTNDTGDHTQLQGNDAPRTPVLPGARPYVPLPAINHPSSTHPGVYLDEIRDIPFGRGNAFVEQPPTDGGIPVSVEVARSYFLGLAMIDYGDIVAAAAQGEEQPANQAGVRHFGVNSAGNPTRPRQEPSNVVRRAPARASNVTSVHRAGRSRSPARDEDSGARGTRTFVRERSVEEPRARATHTVNRMRPNTPHVFPRPVAPDFANNPFNPNVVPYAPGGQDHEALYHIIGLPAPGSDNVWSQFAGLPMRWAYAANTYAPGMTTTGQPVMGPRTRSYDTGTINPTQGQAAGRAQTPGTGNIRLSFAQAPNQGQTRRTSNMSQAPRSAQAPTSVPDTGPALPPPVNFGPNASRIEMTRPGGVATRNRDTAVTDGFASPVPPPATVPMTAPSTTTTFPRGPARRSSRDDRPTNVVRASLIAPPRYAPVLAQAQPAPASATQAQGLATEGTSARRPSSDEEGLNMLVAAAAYVEAQAARSTTPSSGVAAMPNESILPSLPGGLPFGGRLIAFGHVDEQEFLRRAEQFTAARDVASSAAAPAAGAVAADPITIDSASEDGDTDVQARPSSPPDAAAAAAPLSSEPGFFPVDMGDPVSEAAREDDVLEAGVGLGESEEEESEEEEEEDEDEDEEFTASPTPTVATRGLGLVPGRLRSGKEFQ